MIVQLSIGNDWQSLQQSRAALLKYGSGNRLSNINNWYFCIIWCISQFIQHNNQLTKTPTSTSIIPLRWRHNERDSVSNHQPHSCLLNRLFRRRSKKTSKLRVTGLCVWNSPVNSPHKWPVMRKMLPFDDVIMHRSKIRVPLRIDG